jgi:stress response protein YsnF
VQYAREILEKAGGDLRHGGFESEDVTRSQSAAQDEETEEGDKDYRIQLRGEVLRTFRERVQRGEIRLRKEVVTENQVVDVPVTREELVIERVPGTGRPISDTSQLGSGKKPEFLSQKSERASRSNLWSPRKCESESVE